MIAKILQPIRQLLTSSLIKITLSVLGILTVTGAGLAVAHELVFGSRIYPHVYFLDHDLSFKTFGQAETLFTEWQTQLASQPLTFKIDDQEIKTTLAEAGVQIDLTPYLLEAENYGRTEGFIDDLKHQFHLLQNRISITPDLHIGANDKLQAVIASLHQKFDITQTDASLKITNGQVVIADAANGRKINDANLYQQLTTALNQLQSPTITPTFTVVAPAVSKTDIEPLAAMATRWSQKPVQLQHDLLLWKIPAAQLATWIGTTLDNNRHVQLTTNTITAQKDLWNWSTQNVNHDPSDAVFSIDAAGKVTQFVPSQQGIAVNMNDTFAALDTALTATQSTATIAVSQIDPKITTAAVNNLGIKEIVGRGVSYFAGSTVARILNIKAATAKLNGKIIPPGQTFSFDDTVGDISTQAGFVEGLVIVGNATVPGLGGGVCQTSTTMYRAALDGGYPIVERHPHAYRVHYYEEGGPGYEYASPGIDAAVYGPYLDFKFKNDTPYAILIQTHVDDAAKRLVYELYSTKIGRTVAISKPKVYNLTAALPTEYIDDPTFPVGYLKQVDVAAGGAQTDFTRTITNADGSVINETVHTSYKPWAAKFTRGTLGATPPATSENPANVPNT